MNGKDGFGQNSGSEAAAVQLWKASLEEFAGNRRFSGSEAAVRGQGSASLTNRNRQSPHRHNHNHNLYHYTA